MARQFRIFHSKEKKALSFGFWLSTIEKDDIAQVSEEKEGSSLEVARFSTFWPKVSKSLFSLVFLTFALQIYR